MQRIISIWKSDSALKIIIIYIILGFTWILLSDLIINELFGFDSDVLTQAQTVKGWAYIVVTSLLLYGLIRNGVKELNKEHILKFKLQQQLKKKKKYETHVSFTSMFMHDLNNILTIMELNINNLETIECNSEELNITIRDLIKSMKNLKEYVNTYMDYVKQFKSKDSQCDLVDVTRSLFDSIRLLFKNDLNFELYFPIATYRVPLGDNEIKQILLNLILNSRDAIISKNETGTMPKAGLIRIRIFEEEHTALETYFPDRNITGQFVGIEIKDDGIGMQEEIQQKIFQLFFTTKPAGKGTGLGLVSIKNLVEKHGGFIRFESEYGKGTTFFIYLPIIQQ